MNSKNIIFLHGFPVSGLMWEYQVEHFSKKMNVYAPDLRGHGDGPKGVGPWMMAHFAEDLKNYMLENKIDSAHLCGCSMGGYVALQFVDQYPDRVASLILCDSRADSDSNAVKDKRFDMVKRLHREGSLPAFAGEFARTVIGESAQKTKPMLLDKVEKMILANDPKNLALAVGAMASRRDSTENLSKITCPALVIVGTEDKVTPPEVNQEMAKKIKGAEFKKISKAGHFANLEQSDIFNSLLDKFLSDKTVD